VFIPRPDVFIFGLPFWNPTYEQFHDWWIDLVESPEKKNVLLCLANPNTLNIAVEQPAYWKILRGFEVFVNDGVGIRMASRMRGKEVPYNFAGTDLMPRLFRDQQKELTAFFYGAQEEVNAEAVRRITAEYPHIKIVGRINGFCDPETEALPAIQAAGADLLMVAMGQPKQEFWMKTNQEKLNCKVAVTCGGMFDFFSGAKPRAPRFLRQFGMEWVYRLAIEPKRMFRRYVFGNPVFLIRSYLRIKKDELLLKESLSSASESSVNPMSSGGQS